MGLQGRKRKTNLRRRGERGKRGDLRLRRSSESVMEKRAWLRGGKGPEGWLWREIRMHLVWQRQMEDEKGGVKGKRAKHAKGRGEGEIVNRG